MKKFYYLLITVIILAACDNTNTKKSVILDRTKAESLCGEGEQKAMSGDLNKAKNLFEESIEADSTYGVPYHNLANVYFSFGDDKTSLQYSNKAIELDKNFANAYSTRGMTLGRMGRMEEAVESHLKAVELKPNNSKLLMNAGIAYFYSENYTEAYNYYDLALKYTNDDYMVSAIYGCIANAKRKEELYEDALIDYNKAIELNNNNAEAHWNRAVTLQDNLDRADEACADLEKCIQLNYQATKAKYRKSKYCN